MNLFGLQPEEFQKLILSVGSHQKERVLTPLEVAELFERMTSQGATAQDCAAAVHFEGPSMVRRFLSLLSLAPAIRHNVDWGTSGATIGFTAAAEMTRLDLHDQETLANSIIEHSLSAAEVKQIVQLRKRSGRELAACIQEVVGMRPEVVRRHVFVGAVADDAVRHHLGTLTQRERDARFAKHLHKLLPPALTLGARLGANRFTIVTDDDGSARLRAAKPDFETVINTSLAAEKE